MNIYPMRSLHKLVKSKSLLKNFLIGCGLLYTFLYFNSRKVTYEAKLTSWSTSGDMRFRWYDSHLKQIVDPDNQYAWFFALPPQVPDDVAATNQWVNFIQDNKNSVFKITGTRLNDDCGYYGTDHCIQNINIKTIQIDGSNIKKEF